MKLTLFAKPFHIPVWIPVVAAVLMLSGCGGDSDPAPLTEVQRVTNMLTENGGTWEPTLSAGVTIDGVDVTEDLFAGFSITFMENTFTTTGSSPVWLRQDTWTFKDESAKVIIRGQDNKEITITEISASQVKLTLSWDETTTNGGRKRSLKGIHEFLLNK